jgi:two-component system, LytTR family, response regulator
MTHTDHHNKTLRAIIVDDEPRCSDALRGLLNAHCPEVQVLQVCNSVASAVPVLRSENIDVLFLDVELPDGTGFDILKQLDDIRFKTIFTTAHNEYAMKAIKFSALDYLLKPVILEDLQEALTKAAISDGGHEQQTTQMKILREHLSPPQDGMERIALPTQDGFSFVQLHDIIWCEAQSNYTLFTLVHGAPLLVCRTMKEFEDLLEAHGFFRIHHSHIINLLHISKYVKGKGGYVVMSNGRELEVSVRRKEEFIERITN